jgi:hypothetical protein
MASNLNHIELERSIVSPIVDQGEISKLFDTELASHFSQQLEGVVGYLLPVLDQDSYPNESEILLRLKQADATATVRARTVPEGAEFVAQAELRQEVFREYVGRLVAILIDDYELPFAPTEGRIGSLNG